MRTLMTSGLILILLATCAANDDPQAAGAENGRNEMTDDGSTGLAEVLQSGTFGMAAQGDVGRRRAPWVEVATDHESYSSIWTANVGEGNPPAVDFGSNSVVFLLMGPQPTGGYWIKYLSTELENGTLQVAADLQQPGQGDMVTQAFTAPYIVLRVEDREFTVVEWINQGRLLWRTEVGR